MIFFKKITHVFEEKEYEIRVLYDRNIINVAAFLDNHPATGFRHQIQLPKKCDAALVLEQGAADGLVNMTIEDIKQKRWEKISKAILEGAEA